MQPTSTALQEITNLLSEALRLNESIVRFEYSGLQAEYRVDGKGAGRTLKIRERIFPLSTPLYCAAASLAVLEEFSTAVVLFVREAKEAACIMAIAPVEAGSPKSSMALVALAALPFINLQTPPAQLPQ